jgi:hypothetical protein
VGEGEERHDGESRLRRGCFGQKGSRSSPSVCASIRDKAGGRKWLTWKQSNGAASPASPYPPYTNSVCAAVAAAAAAHAGGDAPVVSGIDHFILSAWSLCRTDVTPEPSCPPYK